MRKLFVTLMTSLLSCSSAFAFLPEALESNLEIGVGYRQDELKWVTSANTENTGGGLLVPVNLRSELKWKDLNIWQIEANGKYVTCDNIYLRAYGDYGWITHGRNRDSDFVEGGNSGYYSDDLAVAGPNSEFSRSRNRSKGHVYDASIGAGYQFKVCDETLDVSPLVGYSWHGQHLNIHKGRQSNCGYDSYDYYSGSISGLRSEYHTRWNGPWIGFDYDYKLGCEWAIFGSYEYHWARYHASADWNLRDDLPEGFHHRSRRAWGQVATIGGRWDFCDCWTVSILGRFQWWEAKHGRDRALINNTSDGDVRTHCYQSIPLRKVEWKSASVSVNLGMVF